MTRFAIQQLMPDIAAVVRSCAAFILITLYWVNRLHPPRVDRSILGQIAIAVRIFMLHAIVLMCLLPFEGMVTRVVPWCVLAGLAILPFATFHSIPGGGMSAYSIPKMLMIPFYGIRQFALGFPDRDLLMNRHPEAELYGMDENPPLWADESEP